jgi:dipeptidyl aminopeptidase/acylaminoacyl peptidase
METTINRHLRMLYRIGISLTIIIACQPRFPGLADSPKSLITIEDLVGYTRIRNIRLSPDGEWIAYLAIKPQIADNRYNSSLLLQRAEADTKPIELARFHTTADQTFDKDSGAVKSFGGQVAWSEDSLKLAYTKRANDKVQLWLRHLDNGDDVKVAGDLPNAELVGWEENNTVIEFKVSREDNSTKSTSEPADPAVRVTDDTNFWAASWCNTLSLAKTVHTYRYNVSSRKLIEVGDKTQSDKQYITYEDAKWPTNPGERKLAIRPVISPDKKRSVFLGHASYNVQDKEKAYRHYFVGIRMTGDDTPPKEYLHSPKYISYFQWRGDSKEVYALQYDPEYTAVVAITVDSGEIRQLFKMDFSLMEANWTADGRTFVALKQSSLMPDELVKVDLISGKILILANPNAAFAEKELPKVKFMRVNNPLGGDIFGRLVLPNGYVKGRRYPLIFTTYRAGTGFLEGGVGEEFPILPFAANGFVVFALDAGTSNMVSDSGDLEFTLMRRRRPLDAMQTVRRQLTEEGIIDPERCAVTGLSYGSDIAAYAVATTKIFKAASVSISASDPIVHRLNSVNREKILAKYGYPYPEGAGLEQWKKMSIALNGPNLVTPLLIQSSDSEAMFSLETFKTLKHYSIPVEWYIYLGEGHVKSQPLNKYYVYRRNLDWMRFWLKDEVTSDPDKQEEYSRWKAMREAFRTKN